jgi:hypothetical protein
MEIRNFTVSLVKLISRDATTKHWVTRSCGGSDMEVLRTTHHLCGCIMDHVQREHAR